MNPVIQPKQTTPVFVVALLLDGFAIAQSAHAIDREPGHPPNHRVFRVSVNTFVPPPCAGENVQLSGELHLHFMTINGVAKPQSAELRGVTGTGQSTGRTYVANKNPFIATPRLEKIGNVVSGHWILKFKVVGNPNPPPQGDICPGCVFHFTLKFTVFYLSLPPGKVSGPVATPDVLCQH